MICDYPEDIKAVCLVVERAVSTGDLPVSLVFSCTEPVHPGEVVRNLHEHIRILEARLRQFELDIVRLVETISRQTDKDINGLRTAVSQVLQDEISALRSKDGGRWDRSRIRSKICGSPLSAKALMPIRGSTGIGYETEKRQVIIRLIHRDHFAAWLKKHGEWPLRNHIALSRWFTQSDDASDKPTVAAARIEALKFVADDLRNAGTNPLAFPGTVEDVYNRCRDAAIKMFGSPHGFTSLKTWRSHFWHKSRPPGILEIADPRGTSKKL